MHNPVMYIIAIGWLYVTLLIAANEGSLFRGIVSFIFYGLLPCALLLWISASKIRRQRRAHRARQLARSGEPDQAGHAAGDTVAPIGKEALPLTHGTESTAVNRTDAGAR